MFSATFVAHTTSKVLSVCCQETGGKLAGGKLVGGKLVGGKLAGGKLAGGKLGVYGVINYVEPSATRSRTSFNASCFSGNFYQAWPNNVLSN